MGNRKYNSWIAFLLVVVMCISLLPESMIQAAKKPNLTPTKKNLNVGTSTTIKVKKNGVYKIISTKWKTNSNNVVKLSKAKRTSLKVTAKKVVKLQLLRWLNINPRSLQKQRV